MLTEAEQVAKDRVNWRRSTATLWAMGPKEGKWGEILKHIMVFNNQLPSYYRIPNLF